MRRAERKEGEKRKRGIKKRDLNRRIGEDEEEESEGVDERGYRSDLTTM